MDRFGTYFTHVQTCNVTRVQSATDCFGTYFTHVQTCNVPVFKVLRNVYWASGHLTADLKGGYLNGGLPGTFTGCFRGGILTVASRYFQRA